MSSRRTILAAILLVVATAADVSGSVYDGAGTWTHHRRQAPQHLIRYVANMPDGTVGVDTQAGFHVFDGRVWKLDPYDGDNRSTSAAFFVDAAGRILYQLTDALLVWDPADDSLQRIELPGPSGTLTAANGSDGTVYIASYDGEDAGLYALNGFTLSLLRAGKTRSVAIDRSGNLWITHTDPEAAAPALLMHDASGWTDRTAEIGDLVGSAIDIWLTVAVAPDGAVWVNEKGNYGVYTAGSGWAFHQSAPGSVAPVFLAFDVTGRVWGFGSKWLWYLGDDDAWHKAKQAVSGKLYRPDVMATNNLSAAWTYGADDSDDTDILLYNNTLLYRSVEEQPGVITFEAVASPYDLSSDMVSCLAYYDNKDLFCGHSRLNPLYLNPEYSFYDPRLYPVYSSDSKGLSRFHNGEWNIITKQTIGQKTVQLNNVTDMVIQYNGDLAVYTPSGFCFFDGTTWSYSDSLHTEESYDMMVDPSGTLWVGCFEGLQRYSNNYYVNPDTLYSPYIDGDWDYPAFDRMYHKLYFSPNRNVYLMNREGYILYYHNLVGMAGAIKDDWTNTGLGKYPDIRDFIVDEEDFVIAARGDRIEKMFMNNQQVSIESADTEEPIELDRASFIDTDPNGRVWASGLDNTGFLDDAGVWHRIPELAGIAVDQWAWADDGRVAFNAFTYDLNGDRVYQGVYEFIPDGTGVMEETAPHPFSTVRNYPNPFNSGTTIEFALPEQGMVRVGVYNISGQCVSILYDGALVPGTYQLRWDGMDDTGVPVASGLYFFRIAAGNVTRTGRMLLLK